MTSIFTIIGMMLFFWILLTILNLSISGLLAVFTKIKFKKAFMWGLSSLMIPPAFFIIGIIFGSGRYEVNEVELTFENLPESFDGYRIVHISDIHALSFEYRTEELQEVVEQINSMNPDLVVFTGDLMTTEPEEIDVIAPVLSRLSAVDGVISILGNHDYGIYGDQNRPAEERLGKVIQKEKDMGWTLLLDQHKVIRRGKDSIAVVGVENTTSSPHFPSKGNLKAASAGTEGMFRILLSHDPLHWRDEVIGQDYPLTLSGHTHAMQLSIFGWSPSSFVFPEYKGLYSENGQHLYVNIGLGETLFPLRIGAWAEITVITLRRSQD